MYTRTTKNLDLEREYMPSMHSKRFQNQPHPDLTVLEHYTNLTTQQTEAVLSDSNIKKKLNVPYANTNDRRVVDIFYELEDQGTPIFVFIHGGYWQFVDKSSSGSFVAPLVKRGYRVIVMDYNLCPQVTLTELVEQFKEFLIWIFNYAHSTQTKEITFCGHSAGAHLLANILDLPEVASSEFVALIKAIFLIGGVYDLRELRPLKLINPENILSLNEEISVQLSPVCWTYKHLENFIERRTPIHVLVGKYESNTFRGQSEVYAAQLGGFGLNVHYELFEEYDHFNIIEEAAVTGSRINNYIKEVLGK